MAIEYADVIVDLQYGDTGKGKVAHALAGSGDYNIVLRYNGGSNAGHTVYHNGKKVVTHQVPLGVLYGKKSVIGLGCVVNTIALQNEIKELQAAGFNTNGLIFVDKRAHVVTTENLQEDHADTKIGTTKQGIGPTYRKKYAREGLRIGDLHTFAPELWDNEYYEVIDTYELFHKDKTKYRILCEGAQGFHLDIDWGEYPYVTSSHCTVGSVSLNGIPPKKIRKIIGTMKAYETYVGNRTDYTDENDLTLKKIQELGNEFGATTGRPRKVNWMNLDRVIMAANVNGVTEIIINKADILQEVGKFGVMYDSVMFEFEEYNNFKNFVDAMIHEHCGLRTKIVWSLTPNGI